MFLSKSVGVLTVLTLAVGIVAAQDSMPRYRTFISDTTLPGIDTGIRDKDAPGRRARTRRMPSSAPAGTVSARQHRCEVSTGYRAGCPETHDEPHRRTTMEAPSYADFQIISIDENADPEAAAATLAGNPTSSTRRRATSSIRCSSRTIRCTRSSGTFRRSTWSTHGI
jgi:hypothetical protein